MLSIWKSRGKNYLYIIYKCKGGIILKKSIYKITNKINNKCYIGQTNNVKRRFAEHLHWDAPYRQREEGHKVLYRAFEKYGIENFSFQVLETDILNYDEREQYWIKYYDSLVPNGYNITPGGSAPPVLKGEANPITKHSDDVVEKVKQMLKTTNKTLEEISQETGYSDSGIRRINAGILRHDDNEVYPLRENITKDFAYDRALKIIYDLRFTKLTQKEIGKKYGVGRTTVTAINRGQNYHQEDIDYPIRGKKANQHSKTIQMLDLETDEVLKEFNDAVEASIYLGNKSYASAIRLCASGITWTSHGYGWRYKDN